jgi:hypothetical protein
MVGARRAELGRELAPGPCSSWFAWTRSPIPRSRPASARGELASRRTRRDRRRRRTIPRAARTHPASHPHTRSTYPSGSSAHSGGTTWAPRNVTSSATVPAIVSSRASSSTVSPYPDFTSSVVVPDRSASSASRRAPAANEPRWRPGSLGRSNGCHRRRTTGPASGHRTPRFDRPRRLGAYGHRRSRAVPLVRRDRATGPGCLRAPPLAARPRRPGRRGSRPPHRGRSRAPGRRDGSFVTSSPIPSTSTGHASVIGIRTSRSAATCSAAS